jgi:hypothetical protein
MPCPPHHISSLSIDGDGWIIARRDEKEGREEDDVHGSIEIIPSCRKLLEETKLTLSCDVFGNSDDNNNDANAVALEQLPSRPKLAKCLLKVIADIRRMGAPNARDHRRKEKQQGGEAKPKKNGVKNRRPAKKGNRRVAMMEEQRKLRQENEQQKLEQSTQQSGQAQQDEEMEVPDDDEGFVRIEDGNDPEPADELEIPVGLRLAAVFNSLRVLIDITRPMLNHPKRQDLTLKMLNGPSVKEDDNKHRYFLISKHVYSCVTHWSWKDVTGEYSKLLDELQNGLAERMSKFNDDGRYELVVKDWVVSLFNHELFTNEELLANKCMELSNLNPEGASKLHAALIDRFENDHDYSQDLLKASIIRLQKSLTSAISNVFHGTRLTVYGSCLSGLALEGSHDVDVSIYIPELDTMKRSFDSGTVSADQYEQKMRRIIFKVRDTLQFCRFDRFVDLLAITKARVPVIKGKMYAQNPYTQDGALAFDLCFLNDLAVVNSSLLREYSLFHKNVRILMLSVKSFAKTCGLASAADGTLSSYSWLNLVVFYLQCLGMLPVLQCPIMMKEHGQQSDPANPWHSINGLETFYLTKELVELKNIWKQSSRVKYDNLGVILYGFFNFYSSIFPDKTVAASIRFGKISLQKTALHLTSRLWRLSVEDPFETCNSHCPHDLGCHVKEDGQKRIRETLVRAKNGFEAFLGMLPGETMHADGAYSIFLSSWLGPSKSNIKTEAGLAATAMSRNYHPQTAPSLGRAHDNEVRHQRAGVNGRHLNKGRGTTYYNTTASTRPGKKGNYTTTVYGNTDRISTNDHPRHSKRDGNVHKSRGTTYYNTTSMHPGRENGNGTKIVHGNTDEKSSNDHPRHSKRDGDVRKSRGTTYYNTTLTRPGGENGNDTGNTMEKAATQTAKKTS